MTYQQSPVVRVSSFPQSSMVSPCLWLAPRGRGGGSFCFRVRDSLFRGEGGVVVILNGSSAGYSNGDGVGKDMAGNQQK